MKSKIYWLFLFLVFKFSWAEDWIAVPVELPPICLGSPLPSILDESEYLGLMAMEELAKEENRPLVPKNARNLAAGCVVTASEGLIGDDFLSYQEGGETKYLLTDGLKDSAEYNRMMLVGEKQWAQIDLAKEGNVSAVWLTHTNCEERVFFDVVIQLSNDPEFNEGVVTLFNNDEDNSLGLGAGEDELYLDTHYGLFAGTEGGEPVSARYVRFYSSGNSFEADKNFYIEAEVWGTAAE